MTKYIISQVEFIRNNIQPDVKIHLIGHSIGAYMALQLLKIDDISKQIQHCYALFPTIEYMVMLNIETNKSVF